MSDKGDRKRKEGGGGGDKAKKAKYYQGSKGATGQAIPLGTVGILVTCDNGCEDKAGREAVNLIEEHFDKLASSSGSGGGASAAKPESGTGSGSGGGGGTKDVAALLAAEVAGLKDKAAQRFRWHNTGVKGCVYITFQEGALGDGSPSPVEVVLSLCREADDRKQCRGRHCVRFLPVTSTCFAGLDEIKAAAPKLLAPHFPEGEDAAPIPYAVEYEHRSADGFDRLAVINAFANNIKSPPHKVNLKDPELTVLVQLTRNGCGMAVVPQYRQLAKFNVRKLAEVPEEGSKEGAKEGAKQAQKS